MASCFVAESKGRRISFWFSSFSLFSKTDIFLVAASLKIQQSALRTAVQTRNSFWAQPQKRPQNSLRFWIRFVPDFECKTTIWCISKQLEEARCLLTWCLFRCATTATILQMSAACFWSGRAFLRTSSTCQPELCPRQSDRYNTRMNKRRKVFF